MPQVILPEVRLAFFHGWRPSSDRTGSDGKAIKGKFGAQGIWAPGSKADQIARAAFMEAAAGKWGQNAGNVAASLSKDKKCIRVGNQMLNKDGSIRDGYADMLYVASYAQGAPAIAAHKLHNGLPVLIGENGRGYQERQVNSNQPPQLVDVTDELAFKIIKPYAGCIVNLKIDIYAMDSAPPQGKSINCSLLAVQFVRDGKAFGAGGPGTADGFGDVGGDEPAPQNTAPMFDMFATPAAAAPTTDSLFG